ncbi:MAG: hypothetical protein KGN34_01650 [Sphingomonadales bacterium]|nr:hypothetical protein [Sphingomonadales bacterium]
MSMLDSILGQVGGNLDVAGIASKFGIDPALAQQAVTALAGAHAQPGDTVETAAAQTGIDSGMLGQIASHLGGEGGLGQLSQMLQNNPQAAGLLNMLDRNGDGSPIDDVLGMAKGLFGKS